MLFVESRIMQTEFEKNSGQTQVGNNRLQPPPDATPVRYALRWMNVKYVPGELKAVAYSKGIQIGTAVVKTAGEPVTVRMTPDRAVIRPDGDDLSYVLVEAVDANGNLCPLAMNDVQFSLSGPATIAGVGNGDHHFPCEFVASHVPLFYGKAMLIVKTKEGRGGFIEITATSNGLKETKISLESKNGK
jgi:beta-galactosidase